LKGDLLENDHTFSDPFFALCACFDIVDIYNIHAVRIAKKNSPKRGAGAIIGIRRPSRPLGLKQLSEHKNGVADVTFRMRCLLNSDTGHARGNKRLRISVFSGTPPFCQVGTLTYNYS